MAPYNIRSLGTEEIEKVNPSFVAIEFGKKILSYFIKKNSLVHIDASHNLNVLNFKIFLIIFFIILIYLLFSYYQHGNISQLAWKMFENILQRNRLNYPKSKFFRSLFYFFGLFFFAFYNNSIRSNHVVNDQNKPIDSLHESISREAIGRPIWVHHELAHLKWKLLLNATDDYTELIRQAFKRGINKSLAYITEEDMNKYINLTLERKTFLIGRFICRKILEKCGYTEKL